MGELFEIYGGSTADMLIRYMLSKFLGIYALEIKNQ
jgi:hypothetical protein